MKLIERLKVLYEKITMPIYKYNALKLKASLFEEISKCIFVNVDTDYEYAYNGKGVKLVSFQKSKECIVTVNVPKILEAYNLKFEVPYKTNIIDK